MKKQTPQEKKRLSLKKDRRNTYGESPHAARKAIPLHKKLRNRAERHSAKVRLGVVDEDAVGVDAALARAGKKRKTSWKKQPDAPLEAVIESKLARRERLRKNPRKNAKRPERGEDRPAR